MPAQNFMNHVGHVDQVVAVVALQAAHQHIEFGSKGRITVYTIGITIDAADAHFHEVGEYAGGPVHREVKPLCKPCRVPRFLAAAHLRQGFQVRNRWNREDQPA